MKKLVMKASVLMCICLAFMSCDKDDDPVKEIGGSYKVVMDGKTIAEGKSDDVGFVKGFGWAASIGDGKEISVLISSVPVDAGTTVDIDGSDITVNVGGSLAGGQYLSISGTVTRVSATEISFETSCKDVVTWVNSPVYKISGTIKSDAYKMLKSTN